MALLTANHPAATNIATSPIAQIQGPGPMAMLALRDFTTMAVPTPPEYSTDTMAAATATEVHRHHAETTADVANSGTNGHQRTSVETNPWGAMSSRDIKPNRS